MGLIYLDNAATSWPKPIEVGTAMSRFLERSAGNPGRSGHRLSIEAGRVVASAREAIAQLFGFPDPLRVVFGANCTFALNLAIRGLLRSGDHVITGSMEHNSVMRPLRALEQRGVITLTPVPCAPTGELRLADVAAAMRPETRLMVFNHGSNVTGTLLPIAALGNMARKHQKLLLIDAASTAGAVPIDMEESGVDLLAFTGHKSLMGPTGTGGLVIGDRVDESVLEPLVRGGTGSRSEREVQPTALPDALESGTLNAVGLAGLSAGINWIRERGLDAIRAHHRELTKMLIEGLSELDGVTVYGPKDPNQQTSTVSFSVAGISVADAGSILDTEYGILCRVGLHCAPSAHQTIGTFPHGTIRSAPGPFTTKEDISALLRAVSKLPRS